MESMVGRRVKFSFDHLFEKVVFSAKVVRDDGDKVAVEIPGRVRVMKWAPEVFRNKRVLVSKARAEASMV